MIPLDEALALLDDALSSVRLEEVQVPVHSACGMVLAEDVRSLLELPPFDRSAMDGFAVMEDDERQRYRVIGTVRAGETCNFTLSPGTAVKVMTGAPVPAGTGAVVIREHVEEEGDSILVKKHDTGNVCRRGEDVKKGQVILHKGRRLRPVDTGNLVSCGVLSVRVYRRPRVAVLSTGDELVSLPELAQGGRIMDANGPLLSSVCAAHGIEVVLTQVIPDVPDAVSGALLRALAVADVVLFTGGVSMGDFDCVGDALKGSGRLIFDRVAIKPGKPTTLAMIDGKPVFGLPGNPVSVFVAFHVFVLRALARMCGTEPDGLRRLPLARPFRRRKAERTEFRPARLTPEEVLEPVEYHGSAHLMALSVADGFFVVPAGKTELAAGEVVEFMHFARCLR